MKQMQEKSPCCREQIWRFGQRRRQCSQCHKTWRVWTKKPGRKRRRSNDSKLLSNYVRGKVSIAGHAMRRDTPSLAAVEARLRVARDTFNTKIVWADPPLGSCILIADAFVVTINRETITGYLGLLRPLDDTQAVILPPYYRLGTETSDGWAEAFDNFGDRQLERVEALVCDGAVGLVRQAHRRHWVLQRCHFHLLHKLNSYMKLGSLSRGGPEAEEIHALVRVVLDSYDDQRVERAIVQLKKLTKLVHSAGARTTLSGFTKHWLDYRSYIYYATLNLPRTSNCAEQTIGHIRRLQHSARGWSSHQAFQAWAETSLKQRQTTTCLPSENSTTLI